MKKIKNINLNGVDYNVGFSTNDFTDTLKEKLEGLHENFTEVSYSNETLTITTPDYTSNSGGGGTDEDDPME